VGILDGKTALVVGASAGAGYGIALKLAEEGASMIAAARRMERLQGLVDDAAERGFPGRIVPMVCDVEKEEELEAVVQRALDEFGRIDILAAVSQGHQDNHALIEDTTLQDLVNSFVTGPGYTLVLINKVVPHMKQQGFGRIITMGSGAGKTGAPFHTAYALAKAGIMLLTRKAASEYGQFGITANSITPVSKNDREGSNFITPDPAFVARIPRKYMGTPYEDVAPLVAFLCSDAAGYISGQVIGADGGLSAV